ncbi:unnamed protein product [Bursaphelenchus okinawaensis]|uniref:G_PROTEIN_RECEP_F1_2 domain-containing protein n=1 Tax=Bursaphelenchus okinawaensis TaxID=465554 RepID=A0A811L7I0_9BILA|nr:unnamed protein product [Bursaphelenchus okinawaensis]CAG9118307.1 unnamed protein product [Bursaphelenchus okinawaensis]
MLYNAGWKYWCFDGYQPVLDALNITEEQIPQKMDQIEVDHFVSNVHIVFEFIMAATAFSANTVLFIIMNRLKKQFASFIFILRLAMAVDCFMALCTLTCQPVVHVSYGYFTVYCENPLLPKAMIVKCMAMVFQGTAIIATVVWLPVQFAYRYHVVVEGLEPPEHRKIIYFSATLVAFALTIYNMWAVHRPLPEYQVISRLLYHLDGWNTEPDQVFMGGNIAEPRMWLFAGWNMFSTTVSYAIVIYIELRILTALNKMAKNSGTKQHQELNRALTALAVVPLLTSVVPISIYMTGFFTCFDPGSYFIKITFSLSLASILNPITTIGLIKPYRRMFFSMIGMKHLGVSKTEASKTAGATSVVKPSH